MAYEYEKSVQFLKHFHNSFYPGKMEIGDRGVAKTFVLCETFAVRRGLLPWSRGGGHSTKWITRIYIQHICAVLSRKPHHVPRSLISV